jgi:hypothetical protein
MRQISTSRPSPALLVAVLALVAALAGTAVAGHDASTSALSKKKVKKIARKQAIKQINALVPGLADEQITSRAPGLSVAHADTAAQANAANNATTVNGQRVTRIFAKLPPGTTGRTIATVNVFAIVADCTAGGDVDLVVDPVPPNVDATLQAEGNGDAGPIFQTNGGAELNQVNLDTNGINNNDRGMSTFSAVRSGGFNLTRLIGYEDSPTAFGQNVCVVHGKLISG